MVVIDDRYRGAPTGPPAGPPGPATARLPMLGDALPVEALSLDALCGSALAAYRDEFAAHNVDHPWLALSQEDFLVRLNAASRSPGTGRLHPTRAGLLMFGYEHEIAMVFPGYVLDYRKETDTGETETRNVSNDGRWSGCVFDFWSRVSDRIVANADGVGPPLGRAPANANCALGDAVREGLANALAHADYAGRRHVVVTQRSDRIEYANPGRLRIRSGTAFDGGIADPRNPTLMKMFALIGVCKAAGTGLPLIKRTLVQMGLPEPIISQQSEPDRTVLTVSLAASRALWDGAPVSAGRGRSASDGQREHANASLYVSGESPPSIAGAPAHLTDTDRVARSELTPTPQSVSLFAATLGGEDRDVHVTAQSAHHAAAPRGQLGEDDGAIDAAIARAADEDCRSVLELFRSQRRIRRADVESILGIGWADHH